MENEYVLIMENISKQFPGVRALSDVQLRARKGTVHVAKTAQTNGSMPNLSLRKSRLRTGRCLIGVTPI